MTMLIEYINTVGKMFIEFALPMLLQSSGVIALVLLAEMLLRKRKVHAAVRYWLCMAGLAQLILPVFLPVLGGLGNLAGQKGNPASFSGTGPDLGFAALSWQGMVLVIWVIMAAAMALFLLHRAILAQRIVARAKEAKSLMKGALWYCRKCLNVKQKVELKVTPMAASPAVHGLRRPVILIPHHLSPSLGSRHLRSVLLHELVHVKRGDLWLNMLQAVLQIVYFYNPLLWVANRKIRRIRDQAVNEQVISLMGEKACWYTDTLSNVERLSHGRASLSLRMTSVVESKRPGCTRPPNGSRPMTRTYDHSETPV